MYGYSVPSKSFIALALKFRSLINFELMLCIPYMLGVQVHSFAFAYSVVLHQWGRNYSSLIELVMSLLSKINWHRYMDLSLDFQFNFINLCVYARLAPCCCSVSKSHLTLWSHGQCGLQPARLLYSWDFPGKNTGVSRSRDQTRISFISRWVLYCWATKEAHVTTALSWLSCSEFWNWHVWAL